MPLLIFDTNNKLLSATLSSNNIEDWYGEGIAITVDELPKDLVGLKLNDEFKLEQDFAIYSKHLQLQKKQEIQLESKRLIQELEGEQQWRLRKVEQQAILSKNKTARNQLYSQIEQIRAASNDAEQALMKLNELEKIKSFSFNFSGNQSYQRQNKFAILKNLFRRS
ncbi:hypothetical protein [Pseudoalteromonas denitrificans]|uniref:Uncharacterized protein n=1 Tax=Pseudoalteromonas denitrificans DSM 6059 TaxID=1123010 RepID=A0A1I1Q3Y5_9GAMM|nr:hypothetical protein [Pseudoalteromonas denitrificans]SFD16725.1 hypothetical protein SAMN02745724_03726 [Pseudoalteromonas denitrificans DSM 6059]